MRNNFLAAIFFLLLSGVLIFSWFRAGLIYGGGDVGLQTYNPQRIFEITKNIWWEVTAPGSPVPQGLTSVPFNFLFSLLQLIGFSPLMLQASLFFLVLILMGMGMYLLIVFLFEGVGKKYAILAGLFYIFNPYMMIQVWHRFVHSTFFLVAALPFFLIYWLKWLRTGKLSSLLAFLIVTLLSSYAFGTIAYLITVWLILFLVTIPEIIFPWTGINNLKKISLRFLIGFFIWFITNGWWIIPIFNIAPGFLSEQHSNEETLVTVTNLARQTIIPYSIQMINPFYLFLQLDLGESYHNIVIRLLPWIFVVIILFGVIKGLKYKNAASWGFVYLIVFLLSKGAASPFGNMFVFGIEHFFSLGVLRNPFEKIGVLLPLLSSILLILGTKYIFDLLKEKLNSQLAGLLILIITAPIFLFSHPMYTGQIFGKYNKPEYVEVPDSYRKADEWIKSDYSKDARTNPGKILHLPLTRGESITYKWNHGYNGLEPSALFFTSTPSISHGFNIKRVDDSLTALSLIFHKPYSKDPEKILKLLQGFNVRYIVLHKDVNFLGGDIYDPVVTEEVLNNLPFLNRSQSFGELVIYKLSDHYFKPKITLTNNIQLVYPSNQSFIWSWVIGNSQTMITSINQQIDEKVYDLASQIIIFPKASFIYPKVSFIHSVINQIAADDKTAKLLLSQFERTKPILSQNGETQSEEINDKIISATEKIVTMLRSQIGNEVVPTNSSIENYQSELNDIFSKDLRGSRLLSYINEQDISLLFQVHLSSLAILKEKVDPTTKIKLDKIQGFLRDELVKNNFIPQNPLNLEKQQLSDSQKVFQFQIPKDLKYEILMTDTEGRNIFPESLEKVTLSVNGKAKEFSGKADGKILTFGNFEIKSGLWEFGYDVLPSTNLALPFDKLAKSGNITDSDGAIKIESQGQFGYIENPIPNIRGGDVYRVSFEVLSQNVSGFHFQLAQDTDSINESGQKINQLNEFLPLTGGAWQSLRFTLLPLRLTTQQAAIRFVVASTGQIPPPSILIKNLKIEKVLNSDLVLRSIHEKIGVEENGGQVLNIEQKSPVLYKGEVDIKKPTFLVFSETYHPGWKLKLTDGKKTYFPQKHYMANLYGNAWLVENPGEFDFNLEFEPQRIVNYGMIVAVSSYAVLILLIGWNKFKR